MKIILLQNIQNLGKKGDVKDVSAGYATNFLIPRKLAILATPKELEKLKKTQEAVEEKIEIKKEELKEQAKKIEGHVFEIKKRADEKGTLYGSLDKKEINELLKEKGLTIEEEKINLKEPIKNLGEKEVEIRILPELTIKIKIFIKKGD